MPTDTSEHLSAAGASGASADATDTRALTIIGRGRVGTSLAAALGAAGEPVKVVGREAEEPTAAVLLCVPDGEIEAACRAIAGHGTVRLVGHTSGARGLDALEAATAAGLQTFTLHPLQTFPTPDTPVVDAPCAISGSSPEALGLARRLAETAGMRPFELDDENRAAYHAAASIASNFLVTLEQAATELLHRAGVDNGRDMLAPLVLRTAANWAADGSAAITGPIARGDEQTVSAHLEALRRLDPELLPAYEALAELTRRMVDRAAPASREAGGQARVVRTKAELHAALAPLRREGRTIGLVPTMGCLHDGHLSLIRSARAGHDVVVMSLFVNPVQFGPGEDLAAYPRDESRDVRLASSEGVDIVYAPAADEVYPDGFTTSVEVEGLTDVLCGAPESRGSAHFRGVTTVVAKLLNTVQPDTAYFGQKDAQQALVIQRMCRDLDFPARIAVLPTVREADGLALSSRNAYLTEEERRRAAALPAALREARDSIREGAAADEALATARSALATAGIEPEYLELCDAEDLTPASSLNGRPLLLAVAAQVGRARLIDNLTITTTHNGHDTGPAGTERGS